MSKPRKITPEMRDKIAESLKTKNRAEVCREFGVSYYQISAEFGKKWTHKKGESVTPI